MITIKINNMRSVHLLSCLLLMLYLYGLCAGKLAFQNEIQSIQETG